MSGWARLHIVFFSLVLFSLGIPLWWAHGKEPNTDKVSHQFNLQARAIIEAGARSVPPPVASELRYLLAASRDGGKLLVLLDESPFMHRTERGAEEERVFWDLYRVRAYYWNGEYRAEEYRYWATEALKVWVLVASAISAVWLFACWAVRWIRAGFQREERRRGG